MDFSKFNKSRGDSFNKQKRLLRDVFAGKTVLCDICRKPLVVNKSETGFTVSCPSGCADLQVETE